MADIFYYLSLPYTRVLKRDEDGDTIATIAELDGCVAHGSNDADALTNLLEAQRAWIEAALSDGQDIPAPEIEEDLPSGKFVVRLPRLLHRRLIQAGKQDDVSLNVVMIMAATEYLTRREIKAVAPHDAGDVAAWFMDQGGWKVFSPRPARRDYLSFLQQKRVIEDPSEKIDRHLLTTGGK